MVASNRVVTLVSPDSAPIKRLIQDAKDSGRVIDVTCGRRTRSVIVTDSDHVILSAIQSETISNRLNGDAADADAVCAAIHDGLNSKQWMCGFPDKMMIAKVSGCIVSVYGAEDLVNTFRDKLTAAYENAEIVYDEAIAF